MRLRGTRIAVSELDPEATVVLVDGISACDLISRRAMLSGLAGVEGGGEGSPSREIVLPKSIDVLVGGRNGNRA